MHLCSKAAPAALGGCGGLGQLWEALVELWEALGELWEALYIQKLPINRTSGRYYICKQACITYRKGQRCHFGLKSGFSSSVF